LVHVEFTGQHAHVGKPGIELQGLYIGDIELGGEVHLHAHLTAIGHYGHVGGNDGRHAGLLGGIYDLPHGVEVLVVDNGVDGEIALDAVLVAGLGNLVQVVDIKVVGTV